ncbi:hypothetical protein OCH80_00190 [Lactobacillus sp. 23-2]
MPFWKIQKLNVFAPAEYLAEQKRGGYDLPELFAWIDRIAK